ncbi:MAG TPA: chlorohydrolase family protein [Chloroflexota bacterium]|nr:chlorohydrolase family protein [Chloroflexota bacterium]
MPTPRTRIDAGHIVAYQNDGHRYLRDGVIVVEGDQIVHVGRSCSGPADARIDARTMLVTPGLINTHAHLASSPLDKSFVEDRGRRQFYNSGLFEYLPARSAAQDEAASRACIDYSMGELLRSATTTDLDIGPLAEYAAETAGRAGMRLYMGPGFRSGRWFTPDGKQVVYDWDEEAGRQGLRRAVAFIEQHDGAHGGRIKGFLSPLQVDTCTEELLRETRSVANDLEVPIEIHVSQSVNEFQEMVRRHGRTPIEWLSDIGFLGSDVILGHAIVIAGTSWANFAGDDLRIMADSGCSVAHAVWVFARRGVAMESFARYLAAGVNMTLGTDTCPQSMLEAMKFAAVISKIVERQTEVATAADVFGAATLGGARALGRDDLGRIAPGAKADLLFFDAASTSMVPLRDPIKNVVYSAQASDIHTVMVDGQIVVRDRKALNLDEQAAAQAVQEAGERTWAQMGAADWANRDADQLSPQSFPIWEEPAVSGHESPPPRTSCCRSFVHELKAPPGGPILSRAEGSNRPRESWRHALLGLWRGAAYRVEVLQLLRVGPGHGVCSVRPRQSAGQPLLH